MTSNMIAAPTSRYSRPGYDHTQNAIAQQLSSQQRFQLPAWSPRTGRTAAFTAWFKVLERVAALLNVDLDKLGEEAPTGSQVSQTATRSASADAERWLVLNTILYDVVQPSLTLAGVEADRDLRRVDSLSSGAHADGRKLVAWALKFADVSGLQKQTRIRSALAAAKLQPEATRTQISSFLQRLHALWLLDSTTVPSHPHSYWTHVLVAMPTSPHGSHTVTLRTWLAQHVAAYEKTPHAKVVAAGNNCSFCVGLNGVLQELRIRLGMPTPFYLDSKTTVFVSMNETAVKKSVWLIRRVAVAIRRFCRLMLPNEELYRQHKRYYQRILDHAIVDVWDPQRARPP